MTTKIRIVIRSFDHPFFENHFGGLPPYTRKIGLPESRVLYTVLRSPHIDKKSREQFEMEIKKQFLVIKTERHELRKKFFRLKRLYLELNMKSYFIARPVRIKENSRDCFEVRSLR
uniref:Ribosomal protein S10 n=2 Tax=Cannabis sativa TaxID=3483 RepID=A0A161J2P6_CANSA|nr:ribosomal protein S10 [Cannabis sativa]